MCAESRDSSQSLTGVMAGLADVLVVLTATLLANSTVLLADMLKTTLEFIAVLISWYTMRRIAKGGADQKFEYGMGKLENISSLLVACLMTGCIALISYDAVKSLIHPSHIEGNGIWISLASEFSFFFINAWLYFKNKNAAKQEKSPMLDSQAKLFFSKTLGNIFIFSSLSASFFLHYSWVEYVDPIASLLIAISILLSAFGIFSSSIFDLLDRTLEESAQIVILRVLAKHFSEYDFMHGIRSRSSGREVFIEISLEFNADEKASDAHKTAAAIKKELESEIKNSHVSICLATAPETGKV